MVRDSLHGGVVLRAYVPVEIDMACVTSQDVLSSRGLGDLCVGLGNHRNLSAHWWWHDYRD